MELNKGHVDEFLAFCIEEDIGRGDITSELIFTDNDPAKGVFRSKAKGILAGIPFVKRLFSIVNSSSELNVLIEDGNHISEDDDIAEVTASVKDLMKCERLALNILQRLSGIATSVSNFVEELKGTGTQVLDTRKTTPGMRYMEKYAVRQGGGCNHRMGLFDQVLIKDNHLTHVRRKGGVINLQKVKQDAGSDIAVEVEAADIDDVKTFIRSGPPDIILLDNMTVDEMRESVEYIKKRSPDVKTEASGGITENNARKVAMTGVDRISTGSITHSAEALDIGFYLV